MLQKIIKTREREGQRMNISYEQLKRDSNVKRNNLFLEEVIRCRNRENWLDKTTSELNEFSRNHQEQQRRLYLSQQADGFKSD